MYRFWESIIRPICESIKATTIVEIGAWKGGNTKNLLEFATKHSGTVHVIDPKPEFSIQDWEIKWGKSMQFHKGLSLNILPTIQHPDVVLIDGDHNWYTLIHELRILERNSTKDDTFPIVFIHDTGWPYARRDLYYNPDTIPDAYRHPFTEKGLEPGNPELLDDGINADMHNSIYEHSIKNGVLTAIEDFLSETSLDQFFYNIPGLHGLGILAPKETIDLNVNLQSLLASLQLPNIVRNYVEIVESNRLDLFYQLTCHQKRVSKMLEVTNAITEEKRQITEQKNRALEEKETIERERNDILKEKETIEEQRIRVLEEKEALEQERNNIVNEMQQLTEKNDTLSNSYETLTVEKNEIIEQVQALSQKHVHTKAKLIQSEEKQIELQKMHDLEKVTWQKKETYLQEREKNIIDKLRIERESATSEKNRISQQLEQIKNEIKMLQTNKIEFKKSMSHVQEQFVLHRYTLERMRFSHSWKSTNFLRQTQRILRTIGNGQIMYSFFGVLRFVWAFFGYPCKNSVRFIRHTLLGKKWPVHTSNDQRNIQSLDMKEPCAIDIIIPNYNGPQELRECIESIIRCTHYPYRIIIVNDCSTDPNVGVYLEDLQCTHGTKVVVLENSTNKGFVYSCNLGILYSGRDVILLNNDTIVTPHWLGRIVETATQKQDAASVMPLSNNASIYSVDIEDQIAMYGLDTVSQRIYETSLQSRPAIPTSVGFCMFMRRSAIDAVGILDPAFGVGYGEENDWCMRASAEGFSHYLDDTAFVYHKGGVSMVEAGHIKKGETTIQAHEELLLKKHPHYKREIQNFLKNSTALDSIKKNILTGDLRENKKLSIAYLVHFDPEKSHLGGVELHVKDLIHHLKNTHNITVIFPIKKGFGVHRYEDGNVAQLYKRQSFFNDQGKEIDKLFRILLQTYTIDVLHVHHTINSSFSLISVAKLLHIPVIWTLHDYYTISPYYNLIEPTQTHFSGIPNDELLCPDSSTQTHADWRKMVRTHLQNVSFIVAPSESSLRIFESVFRNMPVSTMVIPHGYGAQSKITPLQLSHNTVCHLGYTHARHKGRNLVMNTASILAKKGIHQVFLGAEREEFWELQDTSNMTFLGRYTHENVLEKLTEINPALVCLLSIWPETFSYTLSEAQACGIPVFATNMGAIAERLYNTNMGEVTDSLDPSTVAQQIENLLHSNRLQKMQNALNDSSLKTASSMGKEYANLYNIVSGHTFNETELKRMEHIKDGNFSSSLTYDSTEYIQNTEQIRTLEYTPRFSVLIPIHAPEDILLWKTFSSITHQTYQNYEIIFVQHSKSLSEDAIIHSLQNATNTETIHVAATFMEACKKAIGDFILPIGQHDRLHPTTLGTIASILNTYTTKPNYILSNYDYFNINAVNRDATTVHTSMLQQNNAGSILGLVAYDKQHLLHHMKTNPVFSSQELHNVLNQLSIYKGEVLHIDQFLLHRHDAPLA